MFMSKSIAFVFCFIFERFRCGVISQDNYLNDEILSGVLHTTKSVLSQEKKKCSRNLLEFRIFI